MKRNLLFLLGIITLFFSCSEVKTEQIQPKNEKIQLAYLHILPNDSIQYTFGNTIGLNKDLDALLDQPLEMFILKDTLHNSILMYFHLFEGQMFINKIAPNKYEFSGKSSLPIDGNWDIPFEEHLILRYILEINQNDYLLYRDKSIQPKLPYDESRISVLEASIFSDTICMNKNIETAFSCYPEALEYEYHLFAALLDDKIQYETQYTTLRDSLDIIGVGQISEYYSGNIMTLVDLGILDGKYGRR